MKETDQIIDWLSSYQQDLVLIVGKHRKSHHLLSAEEIISEINAYILKHPERLVEKGVDCEKEFKKLCYSIARNFITWSAKGYGNKNQLFNTKRIDGIVFDDEGQEKSVFESICDSMGDEDPFFAELKSSKKHKNFLTSILEYSSCLTEKQKMILPYMLTGNSLDSIAEPLGVTHQAVSALMRDAFDRIKSYSTTTPNNFNSQSFINSGIESVNFLFGESRLQARKVSH